MQQKGVSSAERERRKRDLMSERDSDRKCSASEGVEAV